MKKAITSPPLDSGSSLPNLTKRPRRIQLEAIFAIRGFGKLILRPIQPEDEGKMIHFHESISEESVYLRYFQYLGLDRRTAHERLLKICRNSGESYAVIIERPGTRHQSASILAIGRLTKTQDPSVVTFDTLLTDEAQDVRLSKLLLARLIKLARAFGFKLLIADLLVVDHDTLNLCRSLNFAVHSQPQENTLRVSLALKPEEVIPRPRRGIVRVKGRLKN